MHKLYLTCEYYYQYLDSGYDLFGMPAIIGQNKANMRSKILCDPLKCHRASMLLMISWMAVFKSAMVCGLFLYIVFNIAPKIWVTCIQIKRYSRSSQGIYTQAHWVWYFHLWNANNKLHAHAHTNSYHARGEPQHLNFMT